MSDHATVVRLVRAVFPHSGVSSEVFDKAAMAVATAAAIDPEGQQLICAAAGHFAAVDEEEMEEIATQYLADHRSLRELVKSAGATVMYVDSSVWSLIGYEGPSTELGGYINRGFNSLNWLPEPPLTWKAAQHED